MLKLIAIPVAVLMGGAAYVALNAAAPVLIPYQNANRVAQGHAIYDAHCASCHGAALEGEETWQYPDAEGYMPAPPQDGTGHTHDHPDLILFDTVKLGPEQTVCAGRNSRMGGFEDVLSDTEILSVLAFIKSTWPEDVVSRHERVNGRPG